MKTEVSGEVDVCFLDKIVLAIKNLIAQLILKNEL